MAGKAQPGVFSISTDLVEFILLGPDYDRRLLQDSPILGDVWLAYANSPGEIQDLLITPHKAITAGRVAKVVSKQLAEIGRAGKSVQRANLAYLQGIVAARLYFGEVLRVLVPLTDWWGKPNTSRVLAERFQNPSELRAEIKQLLESAASRKSPSSTTSDRRTQPVDRFLALSGLILWAGAQTARRRPRSRTKKSGDVLAEATLHVDAMVKSLVRLRADIASDQAKLEREVARSSEDPLIFHVSLNRQATPALNFSIPAVKADAARTLFNVSCKKIAWAVLDSGIDGNHPAFLAEDGTSRVRETLDFKRIRQIVSPDNRTLEDEHLKSLAESAGISKQEVKRILGRLADDAEDERPVSWDLVEKLIKPRKPQTPLNVHGTHVAGILGADGTKSGNASGMCRDIRLYDFRVLARSIEDTEFAIVAALQYIRYLNEQHIDIRIHGANLSLSIPHNVRNFACGYTPLCIECERLVESGVVVVAAAGNRGYQSFKVEEGIYEGYAAFSITDPGNADGVITVGSTHPRAPHSYGVSYFSSRGPTGDGRLKPDLVAPGERIHATYPNGEWGQENGTSMAAPHVSGAAAMLMARYSELIGQPRRIKKILCESATDLGRERSFQGHGMLDVLRAFQSI